MRFPLQLATTLALTAIAVPAQGLRLVERIASPLLHLEVHDHPAADGAGDPATAAAPGPIDGLLRFVDDPAIRRLLTGGADLAGDGSLRGGTEGGETESGETDPLGHEDLLRALLRLSTGEIELALVDLLPRPAQPALPRIVGRMHLSERGVAAVGELLQNAALVSPGRAYGSVQSYRFRGSAPARGGDAARGGDPDRAGEGVELALVDADLLVANHGDTLARVLRVSGDRTAALVPGSLAADAGHRALVARIEAATPDAGAGRAILSLDWDALAPRIAPVPGSLEHAAWLALGLDRARRVVLGLRRVPAGVATTVVCDGPRALLAAGARSDARALSERLPLGGVAAVALALDPRELLGDGTRRGPLDPIVLACRELGMDFERDVLSRLDGAITARLLWTDERRTATDLTLGFGARSRSSAQALHDLLDAALERERALWGPRPDESGAGSTQSGGTQGSGAFVGAVGDELLLARSPSSVDRVVAAQRGVSRTDRARRQSRVRGAIADLLARQDQRRAVGVFAVDGAALGDTGASDHIGVVVDDDSGLRVEMLSID